MGLSNDTGNPPDDYSDYGSDFTADQEAILTALLPVGPGTQDSEIDNPLKDPDLQRLPTKGEHENVGVARLAPSSQRRVQHLKVAFDFGDQKRPTTTDSEARRIDREEKQSSTTNEAPPSDAVPPAVDTRTPLERFRKKPKKPLSVTDLVSPSWCELQYWFSLTKHGKKRATPAMRQGSKVHKKLEDQVHTTVKVDVESKEDVYGLRIWNMIQGLRTLQETGLTRELEVWGMIDGQMINGVIDELSYISPDPDLEAALERSAQIEAMEPKRTNSAPAPARPSDQSTITDFLTRASPGGHSGVKLESSGQSLFNTETFGAMDNTGVKNEGHEKDSQPRIYITDIKTRSLPSLPRGASFRPTEMQLMIYHRLLSSMLTPDWNPDFVFKRYNLDSTKPFSESFLAHLRELDGDGSKDEDSGGGMAMKAEPDDSDSSYGGSRELEEALQAGAEALDPRRQGQHDAVHDSFIQSEANDSQASAAASQKSPTAAAPTAPTTNTPYSTLDSLVPLLLSTLKATFLPIATSTSTQAANPASSNTLSPLLTATYISTFTSPPPLTQDEYPPNEILGHKSFLYSPTALSTYLDATMAWWRGEREAHGVTEPEAWKCGGCEFADGCSWRENKIEGQKEKMRMMREKRIRSAV